MALHKKFCDYCGKSERTMMMKTEVRRGYIGQTKQVPLQIPLVINFNVTYGCFCDDCGKNRGFIKDVHDMKIAGLSDERPAYLWKGNNHASAD